MTPDSPERFEPRAARAMASMFDGVSPRYDLLNRLMTLGQDESWRRAMWRAVPESARVVLDLCTGNGVSLPGLRRPGRLLLGMDVSLGMLEAAAEEHGGPGWAPRLACADAFRLPLRDGSVDAITVAFGVRNLRPRAQALREMARVLRPGGTLVVLEATAPRPGPFAAFHRFHLSRVVPLLGRLSPDPTAYRYLAESILEFGDGLEFEREMGEAGIPPVSARSFLAGATRLWTGQCRPAGGENPPAAGGVMQVARPGRAGRGQLPQSGAPARNGDGAWTALRFVLSGTLALALGYGLWFFGKWSPRLPLSAAERTGVWVLLGLGFASFAVRTVLLALSLGAPSGRR